MAELERLFVPDRERPHQMPLSGPQYGTYATTRPDLSLLENAIFVLAAKADVPSETLRRNLPRQIRIGPVEEINRLIETLSPGISIEPLPVAPGQLPYHNLHRSH